MNAYEIDIWRSVKHNGEFVVNDPRTEVVHARNETEAKSKIKLAEKKTHQSADLLIDVSAEFIYGCHKIGTVTIEKFYVYSSNRTPTPVKEFQLRNRVKK
jgi:hypothetical protein